MNKNRREQINKIIKNFEDINSELNSVLQDEQTYFDNMPENLQYSMRGQDSENDIELMEEAIDSIDNAISILEEVI